MVIADTMFLVAVQRWSKSDMKQSFAVRFLHFNAYPAKSSLDHSGIIYCLRG